MHSGNVQGLKVLLANTYTLYLKTQNYHWNVVGSNFIMFHEFFEKQYEQLMEELTSTENKISFARQAFNDDVMVYNTYSTQFPPVLIAQYFKFEPANHFEVANEKAKEAVKVAL